jgi:hypothetical protein
MSIEKQKCEIFNFGKLKFLIFRFWRIINDYFFAAPFALDRQIFDFGCGK